MRVVAISGSVRGGSTNTAALDTAVVVAPPGVVVVRYEGLATLPHFNPDHDRDPLAPEVTDLREQLGLADALLLSTPEYAGALPGSFKNLLDWTVGGGEMDRMPVGWVNVSAAPSAAAHAYASLAVVLGYASAAVVEQACVSLPVTRDMIGGDGLIADAGVRDGLRRALEALARHVLAEQ